MTDLDARYGTRSSPRWLWWVVAAVGIALGTAWAAWIAFQPQGLTAVMHSYDVVDDTTVVLTLEIRRDDPVDVECSVYAQGMDHSIVGERTVTIAATDEQVVREPIEVQTTQRAVTGVLRSCQVVR